jgi:hypothetical protein
MFCTFHPIDYESYANYVNVIKLKKDIKLFFMIKNITINKSKKSIESAFSIFFNVRKKNLINVDSSKIIKFKNTLKKIKFDGWFSSIEDGVGVEVALLNDRETYVCEKANIFNSNWNYVYGNNNNTYLNLGSKYKISTIEYPIILIINLIFQNDIENIKNMVVSGIYEPNTVFELILQNANIFYFDNNNKIENINIINKYIINCT